MAIFKAIASAALLAIASSATVDAFAPASLGRNRCHQQQQFFATTEQQHSTPCEAPQGVDAIRLQDASSLRNAVVTNVKGELVKLGDAMTSQALSQKTYDTSVVVFLRHMG